ncbi:MAG: YihY family inner membrane protein [Spirochaetales bacterium]|nr:YihY family inner membrane protein [Spirochaetales bacterium]
MKPNNYISKLSICAAAKKVWDILFCTLKEFLNDGVTIVANGLAFKTIFSLIPVTAVFVYVSSIFPKFADYKGKITKIVVDYLLPDVSADLLKIIDSFVSNVGTIGLVGIIGLIYISLNLFLAIDNQVNRIWQTHRRHSYLRRIPIYVAFLSFLPFLLGGYFHYTGILDSLVLPLSPQFSKFYSTIASFAFLELFFFLIYYAIPNARIHFSKALIVASLSSLFWMILRWIFSYYTKAAIVNWLIYGSVAAVVFAFVWIYLNWLVLLFGVELIKVWQKKLYIQQPIMRKFFLYDIGIIIYILKAINDECGMVLDELSDKLNISKNELTILFRLMKEKQIVICDSSEPQYFHLNRTLSSITLEDIETILLEKIHFSTTKKETAEIYEKICSYYIEYKNKNISIKDILEQNK